MGRSRSTPGLVESKGKVPVSEMQITRKDQTSASTATLLTDDELEREREDKNIAKEVMDSESNVSEGSNKPDIMQTSLKINDNNNGNHFSQPGGGLMGCSPISPSSQSQILYSPQILGPNLQLIGFDRRSPQPQHMIPFYSPVTGTTVPAFCGISPAASSTHLAVPHSIAMHTPSPTMSTDSHHIQMSPLGAEGQPPDAALLAEIKRLRERLMTLETENASMTIKLSQQQWEVENRYQILVIIFNDVTNA